MTEDITAYYLFWIDMAEKASEKELEHWKKFDSATLKEIKRLVWGNNVTEEVFLRWTQGMLRLTNQSFPACGWTAPLALFRKASPRLVCCGQMLKQAPLQIKLFTPRSYSHLTPCLLPVKK